MDIFVIISKVYIKCIDAKLSLGVGDEERQQRSTKENFSG